MIFIGLFVFLLRAFSFIHFLRSRKLCVKFFRSEMFCYILHWNYFFFVFLFLAAQLRFNSDTMLQKKLYHSLCYWIYCLTTINNFWTDAICCQLGLIFFSFYNSKYVRILWLITTKIGILFDKVLQPIGHVQLILFGENTIF